MLTAKDLLTGDIITRRQDRGPEFDVSVLHGIVSFSYLTDHKHDASVKRISRY